MQVTDSETSPKQIPKQGTDFAAELAQVEHWILNWQTSQSVRVLNNTSELQNIKREIIIIVKIEFSWRREGVEVPRGKENQGACCERKIIYSLNR